MSLPKSSPVFKYKTPEYSPITLTRVFSLINVQETLYLDSLNMPVFFYDTVYTKIRQKDLGTGLEIFISVHPSFDDAYFDQEVMGFFFDTINPTTYPFTENVTLSDGMVPPDLDGMKLDYRISALDSVDKFTIYKCEPHFV